MIRKKKSPQDHGRAHLLVYDIPTASKLPNPSAMLWALGAPINLSCWIIPDENVPRVPVAEWRAKGATVEWVRFDERDYETILRLAREALERRLGSIRESVEECMADALEKLAHIPTGDDAALKKGKGRANTVTWRAKRDVERAMECALTFDLTADFEHLFDAARKAIVAQEHLAYDAISKRQTAGQKDAMPLALGEAAS